MSAKQGIAVFVSCLILLTIIVSFIAVGKRVTVDTPYGAVIGSQLDGVSHFYSIPFAQPPVGSLRWQAPKKPLSWKEPIEAFDKPVACPQGANPSPGIMLGESEDCLYLNVWTPATPGPHPVMVWIHGGGFLLGSGSEGGYDGEKLAREQNVTVVSVNYRLSYLGFLRMSDENTDSAAGSESLVPGNQGFLDQVAALEWVQDSIAGFGGDPANVTIFGESAGSISVCMLLASPLTDKLISKAVMQSGTCSLWPALPVADAEAIGQDFLERVGCASKGKPLDCALALSHEQIYTSLGIEDNEIFARLFQEWSFKPVAVTGTDFLPEEPDQLLAASQKPADFAVMIGTNKDEGSMFDGMQEHADTGEGWAEFFDTRYPGQGEAVAKLYPYADFSPSGEATAQSITDSIMTCPSRALADDWSETRPVYFYHFTQKVTAPIFDLMALGYTSDAADLGVAHATEIPYIFKVNGVLGLLVTPKQKLASQGIQNYWGNFAHQSDPNDGELNKWPLYTEANPDYLELNSDFQASSDLRDKYCEYWQANPAVF